MNFKEWCLKKFAELGVEPPQYEYQYHGELSDLLDTDPASAAAMDGANLRGANLPGVDLRDADLLGADLCGTNLRGANLLDADLRGADLRGANLLGANLRDADLLGANLLGANLRDADLLGADLRGVDAVAVVFQAGKHQAIFVGGNGSIGCEFHSYQDWLDSGIEIGKRNGYTDAEIELYMSGIKWAVDYLRTVENDDGSPKGWQE